MRDAASVKYTTSSSTHLGFVAVPDGTATAARTGRAGRRERDLELSEATH